MFEWSPFCIVVDGSLGSWSAWGACSVLCGTGKRHRTRKCDYPTPLGGGKGCDGNTTQEMTCIKPRCSSKYELFFQADVTHP